MRKLKLLLLILWVLIAVGCETAKNIEISSTKPPVYSFPAEPVFVMPEIPNDYMETVEVIRYYDEYTILLQLYIADMKWILTEYGVILKEHARDVTEK